MQIRQPKIRLIFIFIVFLFITTGCLSFDPAKAIEDINNSEHYRIVHKEYFDGKDKQITVEIKKSNKTIIFAYYQEKDKQFNYISYVNQDKNIPVNMCYVHEPSNVAEVEKQSYIKYIDKITVQYNETLKEMGISDKELINIIKHYYE